jgi:hypothetical protein
MKILVLNLNKDISNTPKIYGKYTLPEFVYGWGKRQVTEIGHDMLINEIREYITFDSPYNNRWILNQEFISLENFENESDYIIVWAMNELLENIDYLFIQNSENEFVSKILNDLKTKKAKIIFICGDMTTIWNLLIGDQTYIETGKFDSTIDGSPETLTTWYDFVHGNEIDLDNIILTAPDIKFLPNNSEKVIEDFVGHQDKFPFLPRIYNVDHVGARALMEKNNFYKKLEGIFDKTQDYLREYKFISMMNHMDKPHRIEMAHFFIENNLLDDTFFSIFPFVMDEWNWIEDKEERLEKNKLHCYESTKHWFVGREDVLKNVINRIPYGKDFKKLSVHQWVNPIPHLNSYINIVSETQWDTSQNFGGVMGEQIYTSEKIYKPVLMFQPFLVMGPRGILRAFKQHGFKSFEPLIDESYDEIYDWEERMGAIQKEILRLNKLSLNDIDTLYWKMKDIYIYNFNHIDRHSKNQFAKIISVFDNG